MVRPRGRVDVLDVFPRENIHISLFQMIGKKYFVGDCFAPSFALMVRHIYTENIHT